MTEQRASTPAQTKRRPSSVAVLLVAATCGAAGFLAGRMSLFTNAPPNTTDTADVAISDERTTHHQVSLPSDSTSSLLRFDERLVSPDMPRPDEPDALIAEWMGMVEFLQEEFPDTPDALEVKARSLEFLGRSDDAVATWHRCLELNPEYVHAYYGLGNVAAKKEEWEQAISLFRQAIEYDPSFFLARAALAEVYLLTNRPEEAIATLEPSLPNDPRSQGYYLLGRAYGQLQQLEKAREGYLSAIAIYPQYAEAHHGLGRIQIRLGQREEAQKTMETFRQLRAEQQQQISAMRTPEHDFAAMCDHAAETYDFAARLFALRGQSRTAQRLWHRGTVLGPDHVDSRQALAAIALREGRVRQTIQWMEELAAIQPENEQYWTEAGRLYMTLFDYAAAEDAFKKACEAAPEKADGYAALARLLLESRSDLPQAKAYATEAVKRESSVVAYMLLAEACEANLDRDGALAAVAQAMVLQSDDPELKHIYQTLQQRDPPNKTERP